MMGGATWSEPTVQGRRQMNTTSTRQELFTSGYDGNMAASSHAVGGGGGVGGWSQQPMIVEDHSTAVHSGLMQKSSVTGQQATTSTMSGRQDVNTGSGGLLTVTTRTLSQSSNAGPLSAGRSV